MSDEIRILEGDCREILPTLATASVDAVVTDPPAGIRFMNKSWDHHKGGRVQWVAWLSSVLAECHRIARPGARLLCWAIPRTSHWTGTAIEDAGWLIENRVSHIFGSGFPKGLSQLKPAVEDWWLARKPGGKVPELNVDACRVGIGQGDDIYVKNPHTVMKGGGITSTGLGPAIYDVPAGRYPPNLLLQHSPGCRRVGVKRVKGSQGGTERNPFSFAPNGNFRWGDKSDYRWEELPQKARDYYQSYEATRTGYADPDGMETVPAWDCQDGCPVAALDAISGDLTSGNAGANGHKRVTTLHDTGTPWKGIRRDDDAGRLYGDTGGASRFFPQFQPDADDLAAAEALFTYQAKASTADRGPGNTHPTVKSTSLISWLIRLITPPGGLVLDPFMGSGTGAVVAYRENYRFIGIEADPASVAIARRRIAAERDKTPLFA